MSKERESHNYDAVSLVCIDGDYIEANQMFYRSLGYTRIDEIKIAGGPKNIVQPTKPSYAEIAIDQLNTSISLHGNYPDFPILFIWHRNCGAFGYQDTEMVYKEQMAEILKSGIIDTLKKPVKFIVAEIKERNEKQEPTLVSYSNYEFINGQVTKNTIFIYNKANGS